MPCELVGTITGAQVGKGGYDTAGCKALPTAKPGCNCFRHAVWQGGSRPLAVAGPLITLPGIHTVSQAGREGPAQDSGEGAGQASVR